MTSSLTIAVQGGLCNRLRVVLSALFFSENSQSKVRLVWSKNQECFAHFEELFEPLQSEAFCIIPGQWWLTPVTRFNLHLPALLRLPFFDEQQKNFDPRQHGSLEQWVNQYPRLYLSTGYSLLDYPPAIAQRLRPVKALQQRIDAIVSRFTPHTIGIHIRRTDNAVSIAESPIEAFEQAIEEEIAGHPEALFFLATDEDGLKQQLSQKFPGRILYQTTSAGRDSLDGMCEAVVDLFCLAQTSQLLGSYWSSFTDTAAELGGIPLRIVRHNTETA